MKTLEKSLEQSPHPLRFADKYGHCVQVSQGWLDFTGSRALKQEGQGWSGLIEPADRQRVLAALQAGVDQRSEIQQDYRLRRQDGSYGRISERTCPCFGRSGAIVGYVSAARDMAAPEAVESLPGDELFRPVFDEVPVGMCLLTPEAIVLQSNQHLRHLLGYSGDRLSGRRLTDFLHERGAQAIADRLRQRASAGFCVEVPFLGDGNRLVWARLSGTRIFSSQGEPHIVCIIDDLSLLRRMENRLREETWSGQDLLKGLPRIFYALPEIGNLVCWNPDRAGNGSEEPALHPVKLFDEADQRVLQDAIERVFEEGSSVVEADLFLGKGDRIRYAFNGLRISIGDASFLSGLGVEITRRKVAEQSLLQLNQNLGKCIEERICAVENQSRQLQSLAAQLTQTEQRERRRLAQRLHDDLQQHLVGAKMKIALTRRIHPAADGELRDLDAVLTESIQTSRELATELSPLVLQDGGLVAGIEWLVRRFKASHGIEVILQGAPEVDVQDEDVRSFLFTAVRELLLNAVRHAKVESAAVEIERLENDRVRVTVSAGGYGFEPSIELGEQGFELFGLREQLKCLGGTMTIESDHEKGTRVIMEAPVQPQTNGCENSPLRSGVESPAAVTVPDKSDPIRVLLADDHEMLREGLADLLADQPDIEVVAQASDGAMAVELARQYSPNVIIMDISMPRMNGIEATKKITEEMPWVRVVGLSMHERQDMGAAMRGAGAGEMITKGTDANLLIEAVRAKRSSPRMSA